MRILTGMGAGLVYGLVLNYAGISGTAREWVIDGVLYAGGEIFLATLKLLVVPLVFVSLVCGTASINDIAKLGRVGGKTLALYLTTTAIAITLALMAAVLVEPGDGFALTTNLTYEAVDQLSRLGIGQSTCRR